jgi:hypothetical protein
MGELWYLIKGETFRFHFREAENHRARKRWRSVDQETQCTHLLKGKVCIVGFELSTSFQRRLINCRVDLY